MTELLFWPALIAYGEAAVAFLGEARRPGLGARLGIWGIRVGWLVQTALLAAQAARAGGFPWESWGGSLNLFVWLVVGVYLGWGCAPRFRLLGLGVAPLAAILLGVAGASGGLSVHGRSHYSSVFLVLHVGLVLAAFAGFTVAAGLAGLYLWQERRLKRHDAAILSRPAPSLVALEQLVARTILGALPLLTIGLGIGIARLRDQSARIDAVMLVAIVTWALYAGYLVARFELGWRGRRSAYLALTGFALVVLVRLALPVAHFS
jgi:ABC-type uncharacterized transport system permease subunit